MGAWAEATDAKFIISVGDNFYQTGVESAADEQWDASFRRVYTHPALAQRVWYVVAGNHDEYASNKGLMSQVAWAGDPRWRFPALNYSLAMRLPGSGLYTRMCVRLVMTDTCPFIREYRRPPTGWNPEAETNIWANVNRSNPAAQLEWLRHELSEARAACDAVVVVGHHPVFSGGDHLGSEDLVAAFKPLFDEFAVDAYIAGHDHTLIHMEADGVTYVVSGAGSQIRHTTVSTPETLWFADVGGFTAHSVNASHALHSYIAANGTVLHQVLKALRSGTRDGTREVQ
jgi:acid phosphatase